MKQYYLERLHWIFNYTSKNFFYCLAKTLCLIVGIPIYAVMFALEMVLTFVNMIFSVIPVLNVVVGIICKAIIFVVDKTFFICILTDIGKWRAVHKQEPEYEVLDDEPKEGLAENGKPQEESNDVSQGEQNSHNEEKNVSE